MVCLTSWLLAAGSGIDHGECIHQLLLKASFYGFPRIDFLDFRVLEALAMGPDRKKALLVRPDLGLPSLRATTHTGMEWIPI